MEVRTSLWGTRASLLELVEMAQRGQIQIETQPYPIADALQAYADLSTTAKSAAAPSWCRDLHDAGQARPTPAGKLSK